MGGSVVVVCPHNNAPIIHSLVPQSNIKHYNLPTTRNCSVCCDPSPGSTGPAPSDVSKSFSASSSSLTGSWICDMRGGTGGGVRGVRARGGGWRGESRRRVG